MSILELSILGDALHAGATWVTSTGSTPQPHKEKKVQPQVNL